MTFVAATRLYKHGMYWRATGTGTIDGHAFKAGNLIYAKGDPDADYLLESEVTWGVLANPWFDFVGLTVEVAFDDGALEPDPTWTDITAYVREIPSIFHGSTDEYSPASPSSAQFVLDNNDRRFDPEYADGPYFGSLLPMRRIRVTAVFAGVTYALFAGLIQGWPQSYIDGTDSRIDLRAIDATRFLERSPLPTSALSREILADDPVHYWPMQPVDGGSTFPDAVGSSDMGAMSNSTITSADVAAPLGQPLGVAASRLQADGTATIGSVGSSPLLSEAPTTIEAWFTMAGLNNAFSTSFSTSAGISPYRAMQVGFNSNATMFVSYADGDGATFEDLNISTKSLPLGVMHFVATVDSGDFVIYINAKEWYRETIGAGTPAGIAVSPGVSILPGVTTDGGLNYVSHVAIYNTSLSATRVTAHYHAGLYAWGHPFGERTGDRVNRVLDDIGWPDELRDIDNGDTIHGPYLPGAQSALAYLRQLETAEDGRIFIDAEGRVAFRGRQANWRPALPLLVDEDGAVITDPSEVYLTDHEYTLLSDKDGGGVEFHDIRIDPNSADPIRNIVASSYASGYIRLEDATSTAAYGPNDEVLSIPTVDRPTAARQLAAYRLRTRKDPKTIIRAVTIIPRSNPAEAFPVVLGMDLGTRFRVKLTPRDIGSSYTKVATVEGYEMSFSSRGECRVTPYLSPADEADYFTVGDPILGRLGATAANPVPF